jgi:hypothetical protein
VSYLAASAGLDFGMDAGLVASGISILVAAFTVWQAWAIFRISNAASEQAKRSADAVGESVRKLEALFGQLHNDTHGLLHELIGDMRKHAWHEPPSDETATAVERQGPISHEAARARKEAVAEVSALAERLGASDAQRHKLEHSVRGALDQAIDSSLRTKRDSAQEAIRSQLTEAVAHAQDRGQTAIRADDLLSPLFEKFDPEEAHRALASLRKSRVVDWDGDGEYVEAGRDYPPRPETMAARHPHGLALAR